MVGNDPGAWNREKCI